MDWNCMSTRGCQNWSSFWALNVILSPLFESARKERRDKKGSWREFCMALLSFSKKFKGYKLLESNCFCCCTWSSSRGAETIVNGMTLSTEFNKSHICVGRKKGVCGKRRSIGEITSFSADVTTTSTAATRRHFFASFLSLLCVRKKVYFSSPPKNF